MAQFTQKTVAQKITFHGKGLHSGRMVYLEILPAPAQYGIRFERMDEPYATPVLAHADNVSQTSLSTSIGYDENRVSTIEHLMAALFGLGIDNAHIRLNAPEVPIMDGSSKVFVSKILKAGIKELDFSKKLFVVKKTTTYIDQSTGRSISISPAPSLQFSCFIDFPSKVIGQQSISMYFNEKNFLQLATARTFCHLNEVNTMKQLGLAQGGSLENAVVVTNDKVLNEEGLRGHDEFVRHKLLDGIGDLALIGGCLIGHIELKRTGHAFHAEFLRFALEHQNELFQIVEPERVHTPHAFDEQMALIANMSFA